MRAYAITLGDQVRYAGTAATAKEWKDILLSEAGLGPRDKSCVVSDLDIPTAKPELLEFLNQLQIRFDEGRSVNVHFPPDGPPEAA